MRNISQYIEPGNTIGSADKIWMRDRSKRLANIGCVGDVAVGREEYCSYSSGIGGIANIALCGIRATKSVSKGKLLHKRH